MIELLNVNITDRFVAIPYAVYITKKAICNNSQQCSELTRTKRYLKQTFAYQPDETEWHCQCPF